MTRPKGFKHTEKTKAKMSEAQIGRITTDEAKVNMSQGHWSKKPNAEIIKQRLREARAHQVITDVTRQKLSEAGRGRSLSDEARKIISEKAKLRWERWHAEAIAAHSVNTDIGTQFPVGTTHPTRHSQYTLEKTTYCNERSSWRSQHRIVMEDHIGRPLTKDEHVHHLDGDGTNNAIENLVLLSASQHSKLNQILAFINNCDARLGQAIIDTLRRRLPELN